MLEAEFAVVYNGQDLSMHRYSWVHDQRIDVVFDLPSAPLTPRPVAELSANRAAYGFTKL
jgi:hypothetical protein